MFFVGDDEECFHLPSKTIILPLSILIFLIFYFFRSLTFGVKYIQIHYCKGYVLDAQNREVITGTKLFKTKKTKNYYQYQCISKQFRSWIQSKRISVNFMVYNAKLVNDYFYQSSFIWTNIIDRLVFKKQILTFYSFQHSIVAFFFFKIWRYALIVVNTWAFICCGEQKYHSV